MVLQNEVCEEFYCPSKRLQYHLSWNNEALMYKDSRINLHKIYQISMISRNKRLSAQPSARETCADSFPFPGKILFCTDTIETNEWLSPARSPVTVARLTLFAETSWSAVIKSPKFSERRICLRARAFSAKNPWTNCILRNSDLSEMNECFVFLQSHGRSSGWRGSCEQASSLPEAENFPIHQFFGKILHPFWQITQQLSPCPFDSFLLRDHATTSSVLNYRSRSILHCTDLGIEVFFLDESYDVEVVGESDRHMLLGPAWAVVKPNFHHVLPASAG